MIAGFAETFFTNMGLNKSQMAKKGHLFLKFTFVKNLFYFIAIARLLHAPVNIISELVIRTKITTSNLNEKKTLTKKK